MLRPARARRHRVGRALRRREPAVFSEYADKLSGDVAATRYDQLGMVVAEPYGVVGEIAPWNFPLVMVSWKVGSAPAAGNAVVPKPSEMTPFSTVRLARLAIEAGVPPGIFKIVQGDGRTTGEALTRHPLIAKMTCAGSTRTGASIMASCALQGPKPVTLELGGKSPQLVFDDAPDVDRLAGIIACAITGNAGPGVRGGFAAGRAAGDCRRAGGAHSAALRGSSPRCHLGRANHAFTRHLCAAGRAYP